MAVSGSEKKAGMIDANLLSEGNKVFTLSKIKNAFNC